jgi:hypothetical protein
MRMPEPSGSQADCFATSEVRYIICKPLGRWGTCPSPSHREGLNMNKITVSELLTQHGFTWYQLYKRGAGSKSMCFDWNRGRHLPSSKSAARIARALGIPLPYVLDTLKTRNQWQNSPRVTWGTHVREVLKATSANVKITGRIESDEPTCPHCRRMLNRAA